MTPLTRITYTKPYKEIIDDQAKLAESMYELCATLDVRVKELEGKLKEIGEIKFWLEKDREQVKKIISVPQ